MRVLATFPELVGPPPAAGCAGRSRPADERVAAVAAAAGSAPPPSRSSRGPRPIRITPRPKFPLASIVALGLATAVLWMLVAMREAATPGRPARGERLAAEPVTETVR